MHYCMTVVHKIQLVTHVFAYSSNVWQGDSLTILMNEQCFAN